MSNKWKHQSTLVRNKRVATGLSQREMSLVMGATRGNGQAWSNLERGKAGIPHKHVHVICKKLEIPVQDMVSAMVRDYQEQLIRVIWAHERPELKDRMPQIRVPELPQMVDSEVLDGTV